MTGAVVGETRQRLVAAVLAALLAWTVFGLLEELRVAGLRGKIAQRARLQPHAWQLRANAVERYRELLREVDRQVPPGEPIGFVHRYGAANQGFYARLWAQYLLPGRVIHEAAPENVAALARFWVVYPGRLGGTDAHLVVEHGGGSLYRRGPRVEPNPAPAGTAAPPPASSGRAVLALVALAAGVLAAGWGMVRIGDGRGGGAGGGGEDFAGAVVAAIAGATALHVALVSASLLGVRWSGGVLTVIAALLLVPAAVQLRRRAEPRGITPAVAAATDAPTPRERLFVAAGWTIAAVALLAGAVVAWRLLATTPDFVYHIGLKAQRFAAAGAIDWPFLASRANWHVHADYPTLSSALLALHLRLAGGLHEPALMVPSALALAGIVAAADGTARAMRLPAAVRALLVAALAASVVMVAVGHRLAGAMDALPPLAILAAAPVLVTGSRRPWIVGLAAAFAASVKIEGLPLGAILVVVYLASRLAARHRPTAGELARLLAPLVVVTALWAIPVLRFGLFQEGNAGPFDLARLATIGGALREVLAMRSWHGLGGAVLLVPLLLLGRRSRPLAAVATLQLAFYLWVYLTAPVDTEYYVLSSLPRLLLHLWPPLLVGVALLAAPGDAVSGSDPAGA